MAELPGPKKKKHPFSKRVGSVADMMMQFYRAKVELPTDEEHVSCKIIVETVPLEENVFQTVDVNYVKDDQQQIEESGKVNIFKGKILTYLGIQRVDPPAA